jgi:hypothetical protein
MTRLLRGYGADQWHYWECVAPGCENEAVLAPTTDHAPFWCRDRDPAKVIEANK